ncbi:methyl-accepting chemotaxis protein [Paenibacillus sp. WLX2291]|uniref:methyl-accepting chemotaxis protein n=1 Tax=Paenibacillus sp. WLX2291 TaxID=3296934 RepID=UPI00398400FA
MKTSRLLDILLPLIGAAAALILWMIPSQSVLSAIMLTIAIVAAVVAVVRALRNPVDTELPAQEAEREQTLRSFLFESQVVSDRLLAVVDEVRTSVQTLTNVTELSGQIEQELEQKSAEASSRTREAAALLEEAAHDSDQMASQTASMNEETGDAGAAATELSGALTSADRAMEDIHRLNGQIDERLEELIRHMSDIGAVNVFIREVVDQTSLLALNASIEAARAGDEGRGFAVVAQQIRKLAEQSGEAVGRSASTLNAIVTGVNQVSESMQSSRTAVEQGVGEMRRMQEQMKRLETRISGVSGSARQTDGLGQQQKVRMTEGVHTLTEAATLVEHTTQAMEAMFGHIQQQREQVNRLARIGDEMLAASTELAGTVETFRMEHNSEYAAVDVERYKHILQQATVQLADVSSDERQHEMLLSGYMERERHIEAIWSNAMDGSFIFSRPKAGLLNAKSREWFKQAMDGEVYVSAVYISAITKHPCLTIAAAIVDEHHAPIGVVGIDITLELQQDAKNSAT